MFSSTSQMMTIFLWFLCAATVKLHMSHGNMNVGCNEKDQQVLSIFKQGVKDPSNLLSSWSTQHDCRKWTGVKCNNVTGRVTELKLICPFVSDSSKCLKGEINFSVVELEFLSFLDLSWNDFEAIDFKSMSTNSSNLVYLSLANKGNLRMDNLRWVSRLYSLKYLDLSGIDLSNETNWLQWLNMLPSLMELSLRNCSLSDINLTLGYVNFTSLALFDISGNDINSEMPTWLFNLSKISHLDLSQNFLRGQIPATMLNCQHLNKLDLGNNNLNGSIPKWIGQCEQLNILGLSSNTFSGSIPATIGNLSSLTFLDVYNNSLNGCLPDLGQLSNLAVLDIGYNSMSGNLSEQNFTKFSRLSSLTLSSNAFTFNFDTHWQPPFQLSEIRMSNCKLGPEFPSWLYTQTSLLHMLDISSSGLSFNVGGKLWSFVSQINSLILSNNSISGDISTTLITNSIIDLHSNNFTGGLPRLAPNVLFFSIANNNFSGPLYPLLCQIIMEKQELKILHMPHNLLSGEIPDCWTHWQSLAIVDLRSNSLTGTIPNSMGSLIKLETLRLQNNILFGSIPSSLKSCLVVTRFGIQ